LEWRADNLDQGIDLAEFRPIQYFDQGLVDTTTSSIGRADLTADLAHAAR
jgi:hypothetical protein